MKFYYIKNNKMTQNYPKYFKASLMILYKNIKQMEYKYKHLYKITLPFFINKKFKFLSMIKYTKNQKWTIFCNHSITSIKSKNLKLNIYNSYSNYLRYKISHNNIIIT